LRAGIFVNDRVPAEAKEILAGFDVFEVEANDSVLAECEVLMAWPSRLKPGLISKMWRLRMIQTLTAGAHSLPLGEIRDNVKVFSNAGAFTEPVAEHAWGLLLGMAKGVQARNQRMIPRKLRGKTLLVVGGGEIGSEVARLARSLEMRIMGVSRTFKHPELFDERHPPHSLKEAIGLADAVVLALPLNRETRDLIDGDTLMRSKESVIIVNVGRGESVREGDLVSWLGERKESRYATDVFWKKGGKEVFDTRAWEFPNFGGSLHVSGIPLGETLLVPFTRAAQNVKTFLEKGDASNRVDVNDYI